ncbi:ATP synthase subunit d, mitochondrial-like [Iris pallida]|uniref:ATP synthase subunit d, mitochondrial-like n=1 Tax=Iris pallida TaxID=29817 RepID=A0AAX6H888_IRIPA|nr:ATP synthase subunit d, mitochondrial-like [Iris pallida]KAJ6837053.1 ATP synthase subunit d, mitochondrial-like [Iris pallida]
MKTRRGRSADNSVRSHILCYCPSLDCHQLQEPEPIDWEYYRKGIGSHLVDMYKEAFDSVSWLVLFDFVD